MRKQLQPLSKYIIVTVIVSFGLIACETTLSKSVDAQEYTTLKSRVERQAESIKQTSETLKPYSEYCENLKLLSPLRERMEILDEAFFLALIKDAETDNFNQAYDVLEQMLDVLDEVEIVLQKCEDELPGQSEPTPYATSMQDSWQQDAADAIRTCEDIQQYKDGIYEKLSATQKTDALFDSRADLNYVWIQEGEERLHGVEMPKDGLGWVWNYPVSTTGYSDYVGYFLIENDQCVVEDHVYAPSR